MNWKLFGLSLLAVTGVGLHLAYQTQKANPDQSSEELMAEFADFQATFGKSYASLEEMTYRLSVFQKTREQVRRHNSDPSKTYKLGINKFSDMTFKEFAAYYLSPAEDKDKGLFRNRTPPLYQVSPFEGEFVDWRQRLTLYPPRDKGQCGSGWAFSSNFAVSAAYAISTGEPLPILSVQELNDCSWKYGNRGCVGGGNPRQAYEYIVNRGINLDADYPYTATDESCDYSKAGDGYYRISSQVCVEYGPENMVNALKTTPVSGAMSVEEDFKSYASGIYNPEWCPNGANLSINLVGFNTGSQLPYFIGRNNWGPDWGEGGYFRISITSSTGTCSITAPAQTRYPVL